MNKVKTFVFCFSFSQIFLMGVCGCGNEGRTLEEIVSSKQEAPSSFVDSLYGETEVSPPTASEGLYANDQETGDEMQTLWVHICGYVQNPGIYEFSQGSRIYDCLMAAGGFAEGADETALNLADYLQDGTQIYVPSKEEDREEKDLGGKTEHDTLLNQPNLVDINTASVQELETLPGIGEKRAREIIAYRETNGRFETIEDIQKISGIKEAVYTKIKDLITVGK